MSFLDRLAGRAALPAAYSAAQAIDPYAGFPGAGLGSGLGLPAGYGAGVPGGYVPGAGLNGGYGVPGVPTAYGGYPGGLGGGVPGIPGVTSLPSSVGVPGGLPGVATGVPLGTRSRFGFGQGDPRFGFLSRYPIIPCCVACTLLLALILGAIGVGLPSWSTGTVSANGVSVDRQVGLWQQCGTITGTATSTNCNDVIGQINGGSCSTLVNTINAVRGLAISGLILLALAACYVLLGGCLYNIYISAVAGCLAFLAVILLLIAIILWAAVVFNQTQSTSDCNGFNQNALINGNLCPSCSLGAGWILTLIAAILALLALCCTYCVCFLSRRVAPVIVPPVRPPLGAGLHPLHPPPPPQPVCPPSPCCAVPSSPCRPVYRFNSPPCCPMPTVGCCPAPVGLGHP